MILAFLFLVPSCICSFSDLSGVYIFGKDADNATYLVIRQDKSYSLIERSSYAAEVTVKPFNEVVEVGNWSCIGNSIDLSGNKSREVSERLKISNTNGLRLTPTLGAGRHLNESFKPVAQQNIVSEARQKKGDYWETVNVTLP